VRPLVTRTVAYAAAVRLRASAFRAPGNGLLATFRRLNQNGVATVFGVLVSIGAAYIVSSFPNLMDYMQLVFSFFNAPLFATFLLGMFWKRATPWGGFWGLLAGIIAAAVHYFFYRMEYLHYASEMGANFYQAWWAWLTDFVVTIVVSLFTKRKPLEELQGLVYGLASITEERVSFFRRPEVWGSIAIFFTFALNILFW